MASLRNVLYRMASILGDVNSIRRGPKAVVKRAVRKVAYKQMSKLLRKFL